MAIFIKKPNAWESYTSFENRTDIHSVNERAQERLKFMDIQTDHLEAVRDAGTVLMPYKTEIIQKFFDNITKIPTLTNMIHEHSTFERLKAGYMQYFDEFLQADLSDAYIESRIQIGRVHSQIGLTAEHYLSAHHNLLNLMMTILMEKLYKKPDQMMRQVLAVQKLSGFDQQLIMEVYMEETTRPLLLSVSESLNYMTQLDTSKQLLTGMESMHSESYAVSSATEEMNASIQEVTAQSINVADRTDEAYQAAEVSSAAVHETVKDIEEVGQVYQDVIEQVTMLNREIGDIQEVVGMIAQITEQTNLLALNASIEAARAGEHGRGFAVVADEVRKLAEHTKAQTVLITANMEKLQNFSNTVTSQIGNTEKLVEKSVEGAKQAGIALDQIVAAARETSGATSEIAAMSEEQTAAVDLISQRNSNIFELSTSSRDISQETAKVIYQVSKTIEEFRDLIFNMNIDFSTSAVIESAKTDHLLWKWRIYNLLLGLEDMEASQAGTHHSCRLGEWYYSELPPRITSQAAYKQLEAPHAAVHTLAKQAITQYHSGDLAGAEQTLLEIEENSTLVVKLLMELQQGVK